MDVAGATSHATEQKMGASFDSLRVKTYTCKMGARTLVSEMMGANPHEAAANRAVSSMKRLIWLRLASEETFE